MAPFNIGQVGGILRNLGKVGADIATNYATGGFLDATQVAQGARWAAANPGVLAPPVLAGTALAAATEGLFPRPAGAADEKSLIAAAEKARMQSRPEGTLATLGGKPVQWSLNKGQGSWVPYYRSEGEEARSILAQSPKAPQLPPPPGGSPQDRAYHEEATRIAQQTAQNPLFQKYQVAELTKQYNTASSPAEKQRIGLQIWSQTNPLLAAKLSAGQMGSVESHMAPGMSNAGGSPIGGLPMPTTQFDVTSAVTQPTTMSYQQTFGTAIPGMGMVSATPQVFNPGAAPQLSDGMIQASYGQQLLSSPDFMKVAKDSPFLRQAYQQQGLK
jgi:hypothetical protein